MKNIHVNQMVKERNLEELEEKEHSKEFEEELLDDDNNSISEVGLISKMRNPLRKSWIESEDNNIVFTLGRGLILRIMKIERDGINWWLHIQVYNLSNDSINFRISEIGLNWDNKDFKAEPSHTLEPLEGNAGSDYFFMLGTKEIRKPKYVTLKTTFDDKNFDHIIEPTDLKTLIK